MFDCENASICSFVGSELFNTSKNVDMPTVSGSRIAHFRQQEPINEPVPVKYLIHEEPSLRP